MNQRNDFLQFAKSQVGMKGGNAVRKWYNENVGNIGNYNWPWCAAGISYCAAKAGISGKIITPTASSSVMLHNFQQMGLFRKRGTYTPTGGDIIIFKWLYNTTTDASHVGIVESVKDGYIHTIEFNSGSSHDGSVARWKYLPDNATIVGYCIPKFEISDVKIIDRKSYIRSHPWLDPQYKSSRVLKTLETGTSVTYLEDDEYGWSKVKCDSVVGYVQNCRLSKKGISKFPIVQLKKTKRSKLVRANKYRYVPSDKNVIYVCSIEKGKNNGKSIIRYKGKACYVATSNLKNLTKRK